MEEAVYARQSIEKLDSLSIESQIEQCRRYTQGEPQVFQDKGFSGKNTNRPAFQQLMDAVKAGQISKIYVYRLDRFSRSIVDFGQIWKILEDHNVQFQSVTEQFDTASPMGRAMLNIIMTFAQLERETTAERVRDNYNHRFSLGAWPGGPAPFGYRLTKITDSSGHTVSSLAPNEQAQVIETIFQAYSQEEASLGSVARLLNSSGIPGAKRETWDSVALSRILHSPIYVQAGEDVYWWYLSKGMQIVQPVEAFDGLHACNIMGRRDRSRGKYQDLKDQKLSIANHTGIVPTDLWLRCQEKLERNSQLCRDHAGKYSWLTGLMKCAVCGYAIKINYIGGKFYLICSGRSNVSVCHERIKVDLRELEEAIATQIQSMLQQCPAEDFYESDSPSSSEIQKIEQRIERLVQVLAESDSVSTSYILKEIERCHKEKEELIEKIQQERHRRIPIRLDFCSLTFDEKKAVAAEFIDRILLHNDNVTIKWRV